MALIFCIPLFQKHKIALIDEKDIMMNDNIFYINNTLKGYNHLIKKEIETNIDLWERNKKYLNPYEFINTNYDSNTSCVCSYKVFAKSCNCCKVL